MEVIIGVVVITFDSAASRDSEGVKVSLHSFDASALPLLLFAVGFVYASEGQ